MEWCRMYRLKIVFCVVLLWWELTAGVPDNRDTLTLLSERDKKLQDLLKSLESYSTETHQIMPAYQNSSYLNFTSPFLKASDLPRGRTEIKPADDSIESELGPIHDQQDFFRKMYGTREGVNYLRKKYGPNGLKTARAKYPGVNKGINDLKRANDHYLKMRNRARCRNPVPQVIKVKNYYPDPSKDYLPRCALLHRCGDETGCCDSDAFHCVPKSIQEVVLHFYSFSIGKTGGDSKVEKLLFQNHTACHCQPINDLPRMVNKENVPLDGNDQSPKSKCRDCPMPFNARVYSDGRCGCDCFDRQKPCLRIKRGRDALPEIERRCVEASHCHIPDCEHGVFDPTTGFCPRRHDDSSRNHQPRRPNSPPPNYRWSFLERD